MSTWKKILIIAIPMLVAIGAVAVLVIRHAPSPEDVVDTYLEANFSGNYAGAYQWLSTSDRETVSLEEYKRMETDLETLEQQFNKLREYDTAGFEKQDGGMAVATAEITAPDYNAMRNEYGYEKAIAKVNAEKDGVPEKWPQYFDRRIIEKFTSGDTEIPMRTEKVQYTLVNEKELEEGGFMATIKNFLAKDVWRIFFDWKGQREREEAERLAREKEANIIATRDGLIEEAKGLRDLSRFTDAIATLKKVFEVDPRYAKDKEAQALIDQYAKERTIFKKKRAYIRKMDIGKYKIIQKKTLRGKRPAVRGRLLNANQALTQVDIAVAYLDKQGNVLEERKFTPVKYDMYDPTAYKEPFDKHWFHDYTILLDAPEPPEGWAHKIKVRISNVEFADKKK